MILDIIQNPIIVVPIELIGLMVLTGLIIATGVGAIELIFPVGSVLIIGIPMMVTSITVFLIMLIFSTVFNLWASYFIKKEDKYDDDDTLIAVANSQEIGFMSVLKRCRMKDIPLPIMIIGII